MASLEDNKACSSFYNLNSVVAPPCILFVCITIIIVFSTAKHFTYPNVIPLITFMTLLSTIVTFVIWFLVNRNKRKYLFTKQRKDVTLNVLWAFGLANIFSEALFMGSAIDRLLYDVRQPFSCGHYWKLINSLTKLFFYVGQLGFLSLYGNFRFKPSPWINYGVSLMIIINLIVWFEWLFYDIYFMNVDWRKVFNETIRYHRNGCYYVSSIDLIYLNVSPYIDPMSTEYSLLSIIIVVKMFVSISRYDSNSLSLDYDHQTTSDETTAANIEFVSSKILTRCISTIAVITCGIVFSLPFMTAFTSTFLRTVSSAEVFLIISTMFEIEVLALLYFGKWKLKSQFHECFRKEIPTSGYQTALKCTSSGAVAFETFDGIAGLMRAKEFFCFLLFSNKILQTVVIITLTELIIHTKNVSFRMRHVQDNNFRANCIFLCIFVINVIRWLVESIEMGRIDDRDASFIQKQFYGDTYWKIIKSTIFRFYVFYRFLTTIEMYEIYQNLSINS